MDGWMSGCVSGRMNSFMRDERMGAFKDLIDDQFVKFSGEKEEEVKKG